MSDTTACLIHYGDPSLTAFVHRWLNIYTIPADIAAHFPPYPGVPHVSRIQMNTFAWEPFCAVFRELISTGLVKELHTYDGCVNLRRKRGMNEWSIHSWGLALDFDQKLNPLGGATHFSQAFLNVWRKHAWNCGADWAGRKDPMHFQYTNVFPNPKPLIA